VNPTAARGLARRSGSAVVAVLPQWLVARGIVLGALALAHLFVSRTHPQAATAASVHRGLVSWDAGWYEAIARSGYGPLSTEALRFFPLFPLVAHTLGVVPGVGYGAAVVVLANATALVGTALLFVLARRELGNEPLARRATWILSLAPAAFTYVLGYADGLLLVCATGCFLALRPVSGRRPAWWWAAGLAAAGALTRPVGIALVLPIAVELVRNWSRARRTERVAGIVALCAPVAGLVAYLGWSGATGRGFLEPLRIQTQAGHHGTLGDPFVVAFDALRGALHHHLGTALHVPWVVVVLALVVVVWWRLPASYGAYTTAVVAMGLAGTNLDSFERYALDAFPIAIAAALLTASRQVERAVLTLLGVAMGAYALLAFLGLSVP
jgi:hypothetical protein